MFSKIKGFYYYFENFFALDVALILYLKAYF